VPHDAAYIRNNEDVKTAASIIAPAASPAQAQQALNSMMPYPARQPLPGLSAPPGGGLPGHAAINNTIQTKGPISASGDFGNPNAGQDVAMQPAKIAGWLKMRRLLGV
jgi:hypothetical protein